MSNEPSQEILDLSNLGNEVFDALIDYKNVYDILDLQNNELEN